MDDEYASENALVEELKMSRTPIWEALQRLQHEGFIKILPNQGIAITDLSVKELNHILQEHIQIIDLLKNDEIDSAVKELEDHINNVKIFMY